MIVNIADIEDLPELQKTLLFDESIESLDNNKKVNGIVTIKSLGTKITVEGNIETDITLECDRCLKEYEYHLETQINEIFIKGTLDTNDKNEFELTDELFVEELAGKNEINITDLIYQEIILNIPSQKLCNEKCEGNEYLQNINKNIATDPRLEVFKTYFDKENNENK